METIRVVIADDYARGRRGLVVALSTFEDVIIVGEVADGQAAVEICGEVHPHVVLMDLVMPMMDGIQATRLIRQTYPHVQVIALTGFDDHLRRQVALQAGAFQYLSKDAPNAALIQAIRAAYQAG